MFSKLPSEILSHIFSYDDTYRIIYNKSINLISKFPTYLYTENKTHYYNISISITLGKYKYITKIDFVEIPI